MIRVGVTGHSKLPAETADLVARGLRDALEPLASDGFLGLTCLADGADQLFARAVLSLGGCFEVILPAPDYRDKVVKPHNLAEFDDLISRAADVHYMSFQTSGREAYMAASETLVARADRLLAVWDGQPSDGLGGTADVVAHAHRDGVPVEVVWPAGARRR